MSFGLTLVALFLALAVAWRFLGAYMVAVLDGRVHWLAFVERPLYRLLKVDPESEQSWQQYSVSLLLFSGVSILVTYGLLRLQGLLPFNPQRLPAVSPALAWNTSVAFATNTDWQNYVGEQTMSYFSQMANLAVQNFFSPAVAIAVAVALIRGFARKGSPTIGNFWLDMIRSILYLLLPISFVMALVFVGEGGVQTLGGPAHVHDVLSGAAQTIPRGPVASQEAIKQLGTNGGGFFNANSAHPFENPTGLTNWLTLVLFLSIPVALTYVFGKMVGSLRQGVAVLAAMVFFFGTWTAFTTAAEKGPNPAVAAAGVLQPRGNTVGKEARFGVSSSALFGVAATQTSDGSANSAYDSFTPVGGLGLMTGMMLGEVSPGGVGSGIYTMLLYAIVAVFVGGLMVGRTPEYLGKKIGAKEVKLAAIAILVAPITVLVLSGIAVSVHAGKVAPLNSGPHGFSEILYAFTSQAETNGSAFAGLTGNTPFYNITGGIAILLGRYAVIVPVLALAGTLAAKGIVPASAGTVRTDTPMFVGLLIAVVLIVGGLTFFPAVSLGPVVEALSHGKLY
ncbi:MAG: potassium-transporting ATPase subunit KdpA [Actinomycetota bacterium]|nr:potassium-transporting ATPase subunit KdpA [Actinomycetota bacterium]